MMMKKPPTLTEDPMSDTLDTFLVEHRCRGVLAPHFVRPASAVEETVSVMCRGCGTSLALPLS
jgi:hypothetical protein